MKHTLILTVAAAALAFAPGASAQSSQSSKIVIGDGSASRGSLPAYSHPDQSSFIAALLAIGGPSTSGTIEVMPGTYTFTGTVQIIKPGVRISGGPNAVIRLGPSFNGPLFQVRQPASDCILDGLTLLFEGGAGDAGGRSLVEVVGHGFSLTNCRIAVSSSSTSINILPSSAIRFAGLGGASYFGGSISDNSFVVGRVDDPGGNPVAVDAPGWRLIESNDGRNLRVIGNDFGSGRLELDSSPVLLRNAIHLLDDQWTAIVGNTFSHLESSGAEPGPASALIGSEESAPGKESNHLTITGNVISACDGPSNLCLEGAGFSTITGNTFDRLGSHAQGTVQFLSTGANTLAGNTFTNVGAVAGPSLRTVNGFHVTLQGNNFLVPDEAGVSQGGPQVVLDGEDGALLSGNHFVDSGGTLAQLQLLNSGDCSIVGNRFQTSGCKPIQLTAAGAPQVFVCSNLFELPNAGCSPPPWQNAGYVVLQCNASSGNPRF